MTGGGVDGDEVDVAALLMGAVLLLLSRRLQKSRWKVRAESTLRRECQCQGQRKKMESKRSSEPALTSSAFGP